MKKIILMLFLILFSFCIFADTDLIIIKTTVTSISLSQAFAASEGLLGLYKLSGGFDQNLITNSDFILADDISQNDITIYFKIDQLAKTRTDETIQISVSANKLMNTDADFVLSENKDAKIETGDPEISVVSCLNASALQVVPSFKDNNKVVFTLRYMDYKPLENVNIVTFKSTWNKTSGLAPGLYTSSITLSYIIN